MEDDTKNPIVKKVLKFYNQVTFCSKRIIWGRKHEDWNILQSIVYAVRGLFKRKWSERLYTRVSMYFFVKKFFVKDSETSYFDFAGAKLPDVRKDKEKLELLWGIFRDIFLIPVYFKDNYEGKIAEDVDFNTPEGPYGYLDGDFDVRVKEGDVVIDAGAWIGDFSAYAASKGATAYAFEPCEETYQWLQQTSELNGNLIKPVRLGLGDENCKMRISNNGSNSGANSLVLESVERNELVKVVTLDSFVEEHQLTHVDFIKSDIEGFERNLLMGARETLKKFAPKLAICTYHLPDDPVVLAQIIKEANPNYKIIQLRHKLFAAVI